MTIEAKDQWWNMTLIGDGVAEATIGDVRITVSMNHKWGGEPWQIPPLGMVDVRPRIRIAPYTPPPPPPSRQPISKETKKS